MLLALTAVLTLAAQADTTVLLGTAERDLTGDGAPEILRLVGVGPSVDSLDVTFTIERSGRVLFTAAIAPFTRTVGIGTGAAGTEQGS